MPKPYRQGQLDGLCGIYALVNAVDVLCGPLNRRSAQALFYDMLLFLESRGPLAHRCVDGIHLQEIASLLKHVVCENYPIVRQKPFHTRPRVSMGIYLQTLDAFLALPDTMVFTCIQGQYNHWTLISAITEQLIQLYDADGMHYVLKSSCSMLHSVEQKRHWLMPAHTYLLQRR